MRISDWSSDVCSSDLQFDRGWNHIGRHLRANEILEVLLARLRPLDDLDHRDRDLAEPAVPDRKDARLAPRVVQTQRLRDLLRQDLESAPVDGFVRAAMNPEELVGIEGCQIGRLDKVGARSEEQT